MHFNAVVCTIRDGKRMVEKRVFIEKSFVLGGMNPAGNIYIRSVNDSLLPSYEHLSYARRC